MKLGTARIGDSTRAFRISGDRADYFDAKDVGELLSQPDWRSLATRRGDVPVGSALVSPVTQPRKFICVGLNYYDHAAEVGKSAPEFPTLFTKVPTAITGPRDDIVLPALSTEIDWEAELTVVIGQQVKNADDQQAAAAIAGYTVINDVSVRDWQRRTSEWFQGKNFDRSTPVGPYVVTPDEIDTGAGLTIRTEVNGVAEQQGSTSELIFSPVELIRYISQFLTLEPGDLIATGTPGGVGFIRKPPRFLADGDLLETTIEGIGTLSNTIRFEN
ncbi:fumarylacetoacetate hydrolase family protein [Arthrobacter sp. TB 26]|uniref:fumarylacetoacetate hydrolase family protein n=1 Tax=Arthrobacter sp. TB 26 TaxID=494420 RepID=UPI00040D1295|nr:fumarylacetoacetate hydrolase family protein [Arthrobacter sp. TB 26]